jgi:hypothetical protein
MENPIENGTDGAALAGLWIGRTLSHEPGSLGLMPP